MFFTDLVNVEALEGDLIFIKGENAVFVYTNVFDEEKLISGSKDCNAHLKACGFTAQYIRDNCTRVIVTDDIEGYFLPA